MDFPKESANIEDLFASPPSESEITMPRSAKSYAIVLSRRIQAVVKERELLGDALRSGQFKQGVGKLSSFTESPDDLSHCCLGVYCDIKVEEGILTKKHHDGNSKYVLYFDKTDISPEGKPSHIKSFLNTHLLNLLGLSNANQRILAMANDQKVPFNIIADMLDLMPIEFTN